jgi:tetratricopeptide (TPR) repeat protein
MMADRIAAIEKMLQGSPEDTFLHYSLAMEYRAVGKLDQAQAEFGRCIELDADYLAAYVEGGKCLRSAGKQAEAREMFQQGLALAQRQRNQHIEDFIRQQLESMAE